MAQWSQLSTVGPCPLSAENEGTEVSVGRQNHEGVKPSLGGDQRMKGWDQSSSPRWGRRD